MPTIPGNIEKIKNQIHANVSLIAVVKNVPTDKIFEALDCGITIIGENRIQEAAARNQAIRQKYPNVKIHFIGHLQKNKINQALEMFDVIEAVDSFELAEAINRRARKPIEIFLEVNTSGEKSKFGVKPEDVLPLASRIMHLPLLELTGFMTIGANTYDSKEIRKCFRILRGLRDEANKNGLKNIAHLSMGMTDDFPVAIEEGSDIIRLGRIIFKGA